MSVSTPVPVPRTSYSSTITHTSSSDRNPANAKQNKFVWQHGSKLHSYGRDKAPYPLSYNREVMELWLMDRSFLIEAHKTVSFMNFKGKLPKRCIDIGTGMGDWVIEAAKQWPDCTFVGFDIVNVQLSLDALPRSIAERIEWVHGNFLTIKLPFEDEEFDHIHIQNVGFAVPENKVWNSLFDEFHRILRPGGTIEQMEDDAIFPVLPRWFTEPLHAHLRGPFIHLPDGSRHFSEDPTVPPLEGSHEYELLEMLYYDVFNNRFVNAHPTSILSGYFSSYFGQVLSPQVANFSMPPLAPLMPAPYELTISTHGFSNYKLDVDDEDFLPPVQVDTSDFSLLGSLSTSSQTTVHSTSSHASSSTRASQSSEFSGGPASNSTAPAVARTPSISNVSRSSGSRSSGTSRTSQRALAVVRDDSDSVHIGKTDAIELFPVDERHGYREHSLSMQLYRALWIVLGVKEAMFEELMVRVSKGDRLLRAYGWNDRDDSVAASRQRFEALMEQYKKDVMTRIALWNSLVLHGWPFPRRDPLTKAEQMEEERLRQDVLEARQAANEEELKEFIRSVRVIVGQKV